MSRMIFTLVMVALIGSTAWAASGFQSERKEMSSGAGIVLIAALQRGAAS